MLSFAHVALRDILQSRLRSSLTVAGVAVIVAVFLLLSSVAGGIGNSLSGGASPPRNLILVQRGSFLPDTVRLPQALVGRAQELVPGGTVAPTLYRHFRVEGEIVHLRAVPLESYRIVRDVEIVKGGWLGDSNVIAVGESLASRYGWRVGQSLDVGGEPMRLVGVFSAGEAIQLPRDAPGLVMIDAAGPISLRDWEAHIEGRLQPKIHTRVGGVVLFRAEGGVVGGRGGLGLGGRLVLNKHAKLPLPAALVNDLTQTLNDGL